MGDKLLYKKLFFIFNQEDGGFGTDQNPSGYVRIETRDGKGKLSAVVQNLKEDRGKIVYKLYILSTDNREVKLAFAGVIPIKNGKGELNWEFNPDNLNNTGISINDINTAIVIAEYSDGENQNIICPLAAYRDKKLHWREKLKAVLYAKSEKEAPIDINQKETFKKQDIVSKFEGGIESIHRDHSAQKTQTEEITRNIPQFEENNKNLINKSSEEQNKNSERTAENCVYSQGGNCGLINGDNGYSPCANCFLHSASKKPQNSTDSIGDVQRLRVELDRYYEAYDPFGSRRRDYRWWKTNSPVQLNNVLYQCNIKSPILFNPKILMAHFKYRHLILGIYSDTIKNKEYVVFGVPGVYSIDEKPLRDMCRWAQVEGNRTRYGAFGYWLVYIDPKTGKIV